jgi:hypothetical protein
MLKRMWAWMKERANRVIAYLGGGPGGRDR